MRFISEEPLHDKSSILTVNVPGHLEPTELKRELARRGYQVVKSTVPHNAITNERTGQGIVQVRAPNDRHHEDARREIENIGVRIKQVSNQGKPIDATMNTDIRWR